MRVSVETDDKWREIRLHTPFSEWVDYKHSTLPDALNEYSRKLSGRPYEGVIDASSVSRTVFLTDLW